MNWIYVTRHFSAFLGNLQLTQLERRDALTKANNLAQCLHNKYRPQTTSHENEILLVGSYGKGTAIHPPSDLDMLYLLPYEDYLRFSQRTGNKQSALLQELKECLQETFPKTDFRADGQVIQVPFQTYAVEVVPCWLCTDGTYMTADTTCGGRWKWSNPHAEWNNINCSDMVSSYKATHLIWMLKAWKRYCKPELSSVSLELLAAEFVLQWHNRDKSLFWYDWMIRDFFLWMLSQYDRILLIPRSKNTVSIGNAWWRVTKESYENAFKACVNEHGNYNYLSVDEWKKIFGEQFQIVPNE